MKKFSCQIIKWSLIGLFVRLALMPFTMHGQDLAFINYFPMMFVKNGIWDPYGYIAANFPYFPANYYGPILFLIVSVSNFILIKLPGSVTLIKILEISANMMGKGFTTVDYVHAFSGLQLFKNLFLLKFPYLIFDFIIAAMLLKLAENSKYRITSYKIWMFNIVVLQSVYMAGGAYLITTFFIISALYCASKRMDYASIICLALGGATMLFPYFLILPACFLLGNNWKKRAMLVFAALASTVCVYLPFYMSSKSAVLAFVASSGNVQYLGNVRLILLGVFVILYTLISLNGLKDSRQKNPHEKLLYYFAAILFLSYAAFPTRFRYLVFATPFLALIMPGSGRFSFFILALVLTSAFTWLTDRSLQMGLFSPLNAEYLLNIPAAQEIIGRFINIDVLYRVSARLMTLMFFFGVLWIWGIKTGKEEDLQAL